MKMRVAVLLAVIAMFCAADAQTYPQDDLMSSLTESVDSKAMQKVTLSCITVPSRGYKAECPKGYKVMCCSCTNPGCYWDISNDQTCLCQCAKPISTTVNRIGVIARCCKIAM
ncbi:resistin-like [Acipenser ruthenus]|uniref:resistin-like n=1 Tax=Acipenser ruthenus TaxID=7906 RepID=UPI0027422575|nr:resistin-like [Acipenser ruthenus]XP_058863107.1 resistin-like [Acipenser ruthenus]